MLRILVDSNVILDVLTEDKVWFEWSAAHLKYYADSKILVINPIIYSEVSVRFSHIEEVEKMLPRDYFVRSHLSWETTFLAGKVFLKYKKNGGNKRFALPDFFIGAQAMVENMQLLTRDKQR